MAGELSWQRLPLPEEGRNKSNTSGRLLSTSSLNSIQALRAHESNTNHSKFGMVIRPSTPQPTTVISSARRHGTGKTCAADHSEILERTRTVQDKEIEDVLYAMPSIDLLTRVRLHCPNQYRYRDLGMEFQQHSRE